MQVCGAAHNNNIRSVTLVLYAVDIITSSRANRQFCPYCPFCRAETKPISSSSSIMSTLLSSVAAPSCTWYQNFTTLTCVFEGDRAVPPSCKVDEKRLSFMRRPDEEDASPACTLDAELYAEVLPDKTRQRALPSGLYEVCLVKKAPGEWPSVFADNAYRRLMKVDWTRQIEEDDDAGAYSDDETNEEAQHGLPNFDPSTLSDMNAADLTKMMSSLGGGGGDGEGLGNLFGGGGAGGPMDGADEDDDDDDDDEDEDDDDDDDEDDDSHGAEAEPVE